MLRTATLRAAISLKQYCNGKVGLLGRLIDIEVAVLVGMDGFAKANVLHAAEDPLP